MPGIFRYRRLGLCTACGKKPEPGKKKCTDCLIKFGELQQMKAKGRCTVCGKPNEL